MPTFAVGDRVNWRPANGYGWGWIGNPVAGVIERVGDRSITIRVAREIQGRVELERKHVRAHNLSLRTRFVGAVDELPQRSRPMPPADPPRENVWLALYLAFCSFVCGTAFGIALTEYL